MAEQKGIFPLQGTIRNISFFKSGNSLPIGEVSNHSAASTYLCGFAKK
jgi:hypothetical protein